MRFVSYPISISQALQALILSIFIPAIHTYPATSPLPLTMPPFRIGVLIVPPIQLLDVSPIDLFAMATQSYFRACNLPKPLVDTAIPDDDLSITYISHTGANSTGPTTARLGIHIDTGVDDPKVAPGKLDLIMIPGPPPGQRPPEEVLEFVRGHVEKGAELVTICSGVFVAAYAGVLDGKTATGTRGVQDMLEKDFPKVNWVDKRYVRDGKIWSSGMSAVSSSPRIHPLRWISR